MVDDGWGAVLIVGTVLIILLAVQWYDAKHGINRFDDDDEE